jgi:hypothetical protein
LAIISGSATPIWSASRKPAELQLSHGRLRRLSIPEAAGAPRRDDKNQPAGAAAARAAELLRVWCNNCRHSVDLDPGEQAKRYGDDLDLLAWRERLVCAKCGSRLVDFVVNRSTGEVLDEG